MTTNRVESRRLRWGKITDLFLKYLERTMFRIILRQSDFFERILKIHKYLWYGGLRISICMFGDWNDGYE